MSSHSGPMTHSGINDKKKITYSTMSGNSIWEQIVNNFHCYHTYLHYQQMYNDPSF